MRYLVDNKVYDTEKSELILVYTDIIENKGLFLTTYPRYTHMLFKSSKGQFFVHIGDCKEKDIAYSNKDYIELLTEDEVKDLLHRLNLPNIYEKLFDNLEEG
jgi:hypothetical protein